MKREEVFQALARLRRSLLQIILGVVLLGTLSYPFSKALLRHLQSSLQEDLVAFSIPEAFLSVLKLALYSGLFFSIPILFYHVWKSFSPLFCLKGAKSALPVLLPAILLFYLGAFFCYFITLPFGIRFLVSYQSPVLRPMISVERYLSFCAVFIFAFGFIFELPLILALLSYLRVIDSAFLTRNRRYAILTIAVLSAILTPTPDVFNMGLMGGPLYLLFEIGVILAKIIERKRVKAGKAISGT